VCVCEREACQKALMARRKRKTRKEGGEERTQFSFLVRMRAAQKEACGKERGR
jgi:hypothetical protein